MKTHKEKIEIMYGELQKKGLSKYVIAPPLYRQLWYLGFKWTPPLFNSFIKLWFINGLFFFLLIGTSSVLIDVLMEEPVTWRFLIIHLSSSLFFGLFLAIHYRRQANRLKLSSWDQYGENDTK